MDSFPKKIFAIIEHEREPEDSFIIVSEHVKDMSVPGEPTDVAIYERTGIIKVKNVNQVLES